MARAGYAIVLERRFGIVAPPAQWRYRAMLGERLPAALLSPRCRPPIARAASSQTPLFTQHATALLVRRWGARAPVRRLGYTRRPGLGERRHRLRGPSSRSRTRDRVGVRTRARAVTVAVTGRVTTVPTGSPLRLCVQYVFMPPGSPIGLGKEPVEEWDSQSSFPSPLPSFLGGLHIPDARHIFKRDLMLRPTAG